MYSLLKLVLVVVMGALCIVFRRPIKNAIQRVYGKHLAVKTEKMFSFFDKVNKKSDEICTDVGRRLVKRYSRKI